MLSTIELEWVSESSCSVLEKLYKRKRCSYCKLIFDSTPNIEHIPSSPRENRLGRSFFPARFIQQNVLNRLSLSNESPNPLVHYRTSAPTIPAAIIAPDFHPTAAVGMASPLLVLDAAVVAAAVTWAVDVVDCKLAGTLILFVGKRTGLVTLAVPVPVPTAPVTTVVLAYFKETVLVTAFGFSIPKFGENW